MIFTTYIPIATSACSSSQRRPIRNLGPTQPFSQDTLVVIGDESDNMNLTCVVVGEFSFNSKIIRISTICELLLIHLSK